MKSEPEPTLVLVENDPYDLEVPLVTATPIAEETEEGYAVGNNNDEDAAETGRAFLLIAPSDLRKGCRLDIVVPEDGTTSVVRVPKNVKRGEQFYAQECGPMLHRWYDGEFNCAGPNKPCDWGFCLLSTFCGWIAWGYIARRMNLDIFGRPTTSQRVVAWSFYLTVFFGILNFTAETAGPLLVIAFVCFSVMVRSEARRRYKIHHGAFGDCCFAVWFNCCLAMQTHRHMRYSGENPVNFQGQSARVVKQVDASSVMEADNLEAQN